MGKYATDTSVSVDASRAEIERTLSKYGADEFAYGTRTGEARIQFSMGGRHIRFVLPLPDRNEERFWVTPGRKLRRNEAQAYREWEQACRQRWRALALAIKAKLEAVECGITHFEEEFLAHIVLPNGETYGDFAIPQIAKAYDSGKMPPLLADLRGRQ